MAILFHHQAFQAPSLTSPEKLEALDIHPEERELSFPLKQELSEVPIFRRATQTLTGYQLSEDEPITYHMMGAWIKKIGELFGLEYPTIPYTLRYTAANAFDQSGSSTAYLLLDSLLTHISS